MHSLTAARTAFTVHAFHERAADTALTFAKAGGRVVSVVAAKQGIMHCMWSSSSN